MSYNNLLLNLYFHFYFSIVPQETDFRDSALTQSAYSHYKVNFPKLVFVYLMRIKYDDNVLTPFLISSPAPFFQILLAVLMLVE